MDWTEFAKFISEIIAAVSVTIAALTLIFGISAWRREYIGKRKIELAEDTLMLFYQARDAIQGIRAGYASPSEGSTRKKGEGESPEKTEELNQEYVIYERYQKQEHIFNKLQSTKYRFMARFGEKNEQPFIELSKIINEIFNAAFMLRTYYWKIQGREQMEGEKLEKHLQKLSEYEAVFWFMSEKSDKIGPRVEEAIKQIEEITKTTLEEKEVWFRKISLKRKTKA